jgi:segregation and condensation protein A
MYARQRQRHVRSHVTLENRRVWSLAEAREALERLIGRGSDWTALDMFLLDYLVDPSQRVTALASTFSAMLEMVREGRASVRQDSAFGPILLKAYQTPLRVVG